MTMHHVRDSLQERLILPTALATRGELATYRLQREWAELEWSRERLDEFRRVRCAALLSHAAKTVPYYRALPLGKDAPLSEFPALEKSQVAEDPSALHSLPQGRTTQKFSGGSTGRPVAILKSPLAISAERAASWLAYSWYGLRHGQRAVRFWGTGGARSRRIRATLADIAMNRVTLSAFGFSKAELQPLIRQIQRHRPVYLYGYASMLEMVAGAAPPEGLEVPSLKGVITTAEPLSNQAHRSIAAAFRAPVWNEYGCGEVGPIAYECPEGSLHAMDMNLFLEVDTGASISAEKGATGDLLITDLSNLAMPLIRYRVGDRVTLGGACKCGRALSTIREIGGRSYDYLVDEAGRLYHGEAVMYVFEDLAAGGHAVEAFQVRQKRPGSADVIVVGPTSQDTAAALRSAFADRLSIGISVEVTDRLELAPSGKRRLIVRES